MIKKYLSVNKAIKIRKKYFFDRGEVKLLQIVKNRIINSRIFASQNKQI